MAFEEKPYNIINKGNQFGQREVGITHPDNPGFIRIADNGDIHIFAADGLGIIMSVAQNSIILVGETVKFLTKEDDGLRWNKLAFNAKATKYSEPAFTVPKSQSQSIYSGITEFLD